MSRSDTALEKRSTEESRTPRIVATFAGLGMTAMSLPCVVMAIYDVLYSLEDLTGSIIIGTFFAVLLVIGLGATWWGLFSKRRPSAAARDTEHSVLRAAKALDGKVTVATLAVESGLSLDEAEVALNHMVQRGVAETWVSDAGKLVYAFPAFANPDDRLSAQDPLFVPPTNDEDDALEAAEVEMAEVSRSKG